MYTMGIHGEHETTPLRLGAEPARDTSLANASTKVTE